MTKTPLSTYRVQFNSGFGFKEAVKEAVKDVVEEIVDHQEADEFRK
jgi:maltooligosyltrehalose synthase